MISVIEKILCDYLDSMLSYSVFFEKPKQDIPSEYVLVEKTGGGTSEHIREATIAIQSIGESLLRAAEMAYEVEEVMQNAVTLDAIASVETNSIYNHTHEMVATTKEYRYQGVYSVIFY